MLQGSLLSRVSVNNCFSVIKLMRWIKLNLLYGIRILKKKISVSKSNPNFCENQKVVLLKNCSINFYSILCTYTWSDLVIFGVLTGSGSTPLIKLHNVSNLWYYCRDGSGQTSIQFPPRLATPNGSSARLTNSLETEARQRRHCDTAQFHKWEKITINCVSDLIEHN